MLGMFGDNRDTLPLNSLLYTITLGQSEVCQVFNERKDSMFSQLEIRERYYKCLE